MFHQASGHSDHCAIAVVFLNLSFFATNYKADVPLPDYLTVLSIGWKIRWENRAVGAQNPTIVCNFEKSDGSD